MLRMIALSVFAVSSGDPFAETTLDRTNVRFVIDDNRHMQAVLLAKGYPLHYSEYGCLPSAVPNSP
jgi:hypothetical protein